MKEYTLTVLVLCRPVTGRNAVAASLEERTPRHLCVGFPMPMPGSLSRKLFPVFGDSEFHDLSDEPQGKRSDVGKLNRALGVPEF